MKKSSKIIVILVIILLLAVIGVGGYLLFKNNKKIGELENKITKVEEKNTISNNQNLVSNNQNSENIASNNTLESNTNKTENTTESKESSTTTQNTTSSIDYTKLNGTYTRIDESKRTSGILTINNASENSLNFKIDATKVFNNENETIQEAIDRGAVNLGYFEGVAYKIDNNTWKCQDNSEMAKDFGGYAVTLKLENDNSITFTETYDDTTNSTSLYCGGGVYLNGTYTK